MAELYGRRISALLAADTYMQVRIYRLAKLDSQLHELAEVTAQIGGLRGDLTQIDLTGRTVERVHGEGVDDTHVQSAIRY